MPATRPARPSPTRRLDRAERALLEAGRTLQKDVLEAIRAVDTARADLQKAGADYQLAIIELERLKGSL